MAVSTAEAIILDEEAVGVVVVKAEEEEISASRAMGFVVEWTAAATRSLQLLVLYCFSDLCMSVVSLRRVSFNNVFME
jgi:hypothetical protein